MKLTIIMLSLRVGRASSFFTPKVLSRCPKKAAHVGRIMSAPPSSPCTTRLFSEGDKPKFDGEVAKIYQVIAENHRHPTGPWVTMVDQVRAHVEKTGNAKFRLLDLATGPGEPAETIARAFPESTVVATDLSPDQIEIARKQTATLAHMTCEVADMESLQFENDSFDIITCCYGFMFPPDIPKAVGESFRVLKPGGILVATTWNRLKPMENLRAIMTKVLGTTPPAPPINPLALKDKGLFESYLEKAGYQDITTAAYEYPFDMTADKDMQFLASTLPVKEKLDEMNAWEKAREAYEAFKMDYGSYDDNGHLIFPGNEYKLTVAVKRG